jgi:hypothetical protein
MIVLAFYVFAVLNRVLSDTCQYNDTYLLYFTTTYDS